MSKTTDGIKALPLSDGGRKDSYYSRSVRQIENGYIESTYDGERSRERFLQAPPKDTGNTLSDAAAYLKRK